MNAVLSFSASHQRVPRREPPDVPESAAPDKSIDKLLSVRTQRLQRLQREAHEARLAWRAERSGLRDQNERWHQAAEEARKYWNEAREQFFRMRTTSGEFRRCKGHYERLVSEAAQIRLECQERVSSSKARRREYFSARHRVIGAQRQQEKLSIYRDEVRSLTMAQER